MTQGEDAYERLSRQLIEIHDLNNSSNLHATTENGFFDTCLNHPEMTI